MPLVSVVMPVYNTEKYVGEAIESILAQTFEDFECIIIDDGSADKSREIISSYAKKDDRIVAIKNSSNKKICYSLNKAIAIATGTYIARMDADDIAHPQRFEVQLEMFNKDNSLSIVGSQLLLIDETGKKIGKRFYTGSFSDILSYQSPTAHPSVMFKKSIIDIVGGYDDTFRYAEDYDLRLRCHHAGCTGYNTSRILLRYRITSDQTKSTALKKQLSQTIKVKKNALAKGYIKGSIFFYIRLYFESFLLCLPNRLVLFLFWLSLRMKLGKWLRS